MGEREREREREMRMKMDKKERKRKAIGQKEFFIYRITSVTGEAVHKVHVSLRYTWHFLSLPF